MEKLIIGGDNMTIEEIIIGESKNMEFKVSRPELFLALMMIRGRLLAFRRKRFFVRWMLSRMPYLTAVNR